jgi:aryl-alcohol dehydrogenase-like predicted oxidoreductase
MRPRSAELGRLALGCGNFGGVGSAPAFFGQGTDEETAFAIMDAAWERGIRWFDTGDAYGGGRSEAWIGRWRRDRGADELRLTTKVFHSTSGDPSDHGLAPGRIRRQIHASLDRLRVDRVDLHLAHEPDPDTPLAATIETFDDLLREGLIGSWGLSNYDAAGIADVLSYGKPALVQNSYSLLDRGDERAVLPLCVANGIGYQAFSPLAGGWLTGKYRRGEAFPPGSRMTQRPEPYRELVSDRIFDGLERLAEEAAARDIELTTLAFAWVLSNPHVDGVVCGPVRPEHLDPALAATDVALDEADWKRLASFFD